MRLIETPIIDEIADKLHVGDMIYISGHIYCGRDAVLPKLCRMIRENELKNTDIRLQGSIIFHTAVSPAGIGPTSSNKCEIESSIPILSEAGVKLHLGKGKIGEKTVEALARYSSVYAVIPPITALLKNNTLDERLVAFPELGMEALYELQVVRFPAIIAAAHNKSIY